MDIYLDFGEEYTSFRRALQLSPRRNLPGLYSNFIESFFNAVEFLRSVNHNFVNEAHLLRVLGRETSYVVDQTFYNVGPRITATLRPRALRHIYHRLAEVGVTPERMEYYQTMDRHPTVARTPHYAPQRPPLPVADPNSDDDMMEGLGMYG